MSLIGQGAVAIWHDVTAQGRQEFYAWHGQEHMPERVGVPGFLRGRRYVALRADLEFFNLYEAKSPAVLAGPDYQARLNAPTPWTQSTVKEFRRVTRSICTVAATFGRGQGGLMATWRYDVHGDRSGEHIAALKSQILPEIAASRHIAGAHLLVADTALSAVDTAERKARGAPNQVSSWMLLVEGWGDEAAFDAFCQPALADDVLGGIGARVAAEIGLYRLQATITKADLGTH